MEDKMIDLEQLAKAIRQRNVADVEIARIIDRPALIGHAGEFIAAKVFNIKLEPSATRKSIDGYFTQGNLAGKTVNIKWYGKVEGILDITPEALPDFYLVLTGPKGAPTSSRGTMRPWLISYVFLFDAAKLLADLRGVKVGIATSVKQHIWDMAEIYPTQRNNQIVISKEQRGLLALFG